MSSHLVDGVPLPDAVAGHPALDFCNTRAGWGEPSPKEYLTSADTVALWCLDAGLLEVARAATLREWLSARPEDGAALLHRVLSLREAFYPVALGAREGEAWEHVAAEAHRERSVSVLVPGGVGRPAAWRPPAAVDADTPLLVIAGATSDLVTSAAGTAVRACPGAGCGWLFTDLRRRRRWCSMAVCGNRAKARRHAERRTGRSTATPGTPGTPAGGF